MKPIVNVLIALFAAATLGGVLTACDSTSGHNSGEAALKSANKSALRNANKTPERSAKDVRGATPYIEIKDEPAPKLIMDPPIPEGLAIGVFWAQYRVENLRIVPVFGKGAVQVSPRVGHLHIIVDDLPWWWADASDNNTIDIAGLPPGPHKVKISLVNSNHQVFPGQSKTFTFTIPEGALGSHSH